MTRHRSSLAGKRAQAAKELQKSLESANIKLQSVVTDIPGASSIEMLQELASGRNNPKELAQLAKRRLRAEIPELEKALSGNLRRYHKIILEQLLADIGLFAAQIAELHAYIENLLQEDEETIHRLDVTPGINRRVAEIVIAEAVLTWTVFRTNITLLPGSGFVRDRTKVPASEKAVGLAKATEL